MSEPTPEPPVPVIVCAEMRRPQFVSTMFDDLLPVGVRLASYVMRKPCWTLTFEGTAPGPALDEATTEAVRERMESSDDVDQAARADLRLKRDAVLGDDPIAQAVRAAINYLLGETS